MSQGLPAKISPSSSSQQFMSMSFEGTGGRGHYSSMDSTPGKVSTAGSLYQSFPGTSETTSESYQTDRSMERIYSEGETRSRSSVTVQKNKKRRGPRHYQAPISSSAFARRPVLRSRSVHSMLSVTVRDIKEDEEEEDDDDDSSESVTIWNSTKRQKVILVCLALGELLAFTSYALLAPFFPQEATYRNISPATSGWVFGVFSLVQFISAPIMGKLVPRVGPKAMFMCGGFCCGVFTIIFGYLDALPNDPKSNQLFIGFCFMVRIAMALGASAWATASFTIATSTFSDNPASVMGLLETAVGIGLMLGPAIGGVLYEAGGFKLPFIVIGVAILLSLPIQYSVLQKDVAIDEAEDGSVMDLLRIPAIPIVGIAVFVAACLWTVLDPTLEPHLRQFELSPSKIGLVFVLMAVCYAVLAPIVGCVADKIDDSTPLMIVGFIILSAGYLLIGPAPFLGLGNFLWLNLVAVSVMGVGMSLAIVPTYDKIIWSAEKSGIEDTLGMHGAVAGLFNSIYALGETAGPGLAGWLTETQGFPWTMAVCSCISGCMVILLTVLWFLENYSPYIKYKYPDGYEPEKDPLLKKEKDYTFVDYDCDK